MLPAPLGCFLLSLFLPTIVSLTSLGAMNGPDLWKTATATYGFPQSALRVSAGPAPAARSLVAAADAAAVVGHPADVATQLALAPVAAIPEARPPDGGRLGIGVLGVGRVQGGERLGR